MKNKVMILNDTAWTHYRSSVYNELYSLLKAGNMDMIVIHVALVSRMHELMKDACDLTLYTYPYHMLFNKNFEAITMFQKNLSIFKEIWKFRPKALIITGYYDLSFFMAVLVAKIIKIKVIAIIDSTRYNKPKISFKEIYKKLFLGFCNAIFCPGSEAKEYVKRWGVAEENIFIVNLTPDFSTLEKLWLEARDKKEELRKEYNFKPHNFLYVGRLSSEKNLEILLKAFYQIKKNDNKAESWGLIIVGGGQKETELKRLAKQLNLSDVYFLGIKPWKILPVFYSLSDVFILPSSYDTWGVVVNEAMICGLPVIVSNRCGSAYDLVEEGKNGFTFSPNNVNELVDIMLKFIDEEVSGYEMGQISRDIIKNYTPENSAREMFKGINFVLGGE